MNNPEIPVYREQKAESYHPVLWIIGSIFAIVGAYYSQFGILFHLKSALLTWFSAWFIFFGWILQTWYFSINGEEKHDHNSGIMSLSSNPLLLSDYLIISGLIGMAIHPIALFSWIISVKILLFYFINNKLNFNILKIENFTFSLKKYKESDRKIDLKNGIRASSGTAIITIILLYMILFLRNRAINRSISTEIETGILCLLLVFIAVKIFLSVNRQTNTSKQSQ
jgi:hypothetical protein